MTLYQFVRPARLSACLRTFCGSASLVRISPFDAQSRRHTAFAGVEVAPFIDESVILGGFYTPGVGVVDSLQAGTLMRQAAVDMGALTIGAGTEVTGIDTERGRVRRVRTNHGDIATDGQLIEAGNAQIYGDVATNAGTVSGAANITGIERTDFYQEPIPVGAPSWSTWNSSPSLVTGTTTINADATKGSAASRYTLSSISLSGNKTLTVAGNPNASQTYIEIYVTGDISVSGTGQIVVQRSHRLGAASRRCPRLGQRGHQRERGPEQ